MRILAITTVLITAGACITGGWENAYTSLMLSSIVLAILTLADVVADSVINKKRQKK